MFLKMLYMYSIIVVAVLLTMLVCILPLIFTVLIECIMILQINDTPIVKKVKPRRFIFQEFFLFQFQDLFKIF